MQRHLKLQQKRLKREKKKKLKSTTRENKYYPSIFCLKENTFIGISDITVKKKKWKILNEHWQEGKCRFRSEDYKIDVNNFKEGEIVNCPKCGGNVDFRIWISSRTPHFV